MLLGLGTGSTAAHAVRLIGERRLKVRAVATSNATAELAREMRIPLVTLAEVDRLDLAIDGADEIDPHLRLIKGGGGALLREKVVASAADRFVVIADASKRVPQLGAFPLPVEVIPFAAPLLRRRIAALGAEVSVRGGGQPVVTDEKHWILDCRFGAIPDPETLDAELRLMPGVVETGLFLGMADEAIIASGETVAFVGAGLARPASPHH